MGYVQRIAVLCLAACLVVGVRAVANAAGPGTLGQQTGTNTDFTPVPTDSAPGWKMFDGALFGHHGTLVGQDQGSQEAPSQTPFTVDFFSVRFDPDPAKTDGFAAGAACADPNTSFGETDDCSRVPAIWRFEDDNWSQVDLPGGAGGANPKPGYVGAIAYMADGKVLAVGGNGCYPRREEPCSGDSGPKDGDPAGKPRAWLYDGQSWQEISDQFDSISMDGGETPGGLSALDCANHTRDTTHFDAGSLYGGEDCVAGGLHELWIWRGSSFVRSYDNQSTSGWKNELCGNADSGAGSWGSLACNLSSLRDSPVDSTSGPSASEFRFRVRDIRWTGSNGIDTWAAVTAGCCSEPPGAADPSVETSGPRLLLNDGSHWSAGALNEPDLATASGGGQASSTVADSYYSVAPSYSSASGPLSSLSFIASPGGPAQQPAGPSGGGEPGARIIWDRTQAGTGQNDSADNADLMSLRLAGVRLVSADGDFGGPSGEHGQAAVTGGAFTGGGDTSPDGLLDWAVGSLTSSSACESPPGSSGDCQGAAYTTLRQTELTPNPLTCNAESVELGCQPAPRKEVTDGSYANGAVANAKSSGELMKLPSYAVNSLSFVPNTHGDTAWAVGYKGAILRLGGKGSVGAPTEPSPPQLGPQRPAALSDRSAYEAKRPPETTGDVGAVPPLAARPLDQHPPSLVAAGSSDPQGVIGSNPTSIAMSRDGSEGWAVGPGRDGRSTTLVHYEGGTWTTCLSAGIPGQLAADRACSALAPLFAKGVTLQTLARLPLENDSDPANDDEFEVMASGSGRVAIYIDGRWSLEGSLVDRLSAGFPGGGDVVFSAPDDGWLVVRDIDGYDLFHFDGTHWLVCGTSAVNGQVRDPHPELCGDSANKLPFFKGGMQGSLYLALAGQRVYMAGTRSIKPSGSTGVSTVDSSIAQSAKGTPYPVIYRHDPGGDWTPDYDPGCDSRSGPSTQECLGSSDSAKQGSLTAFSAAQLSGGRFAGWATGTFGPASPPRAGDLTYTQSAAGPKPGLLRMGSGSSSWRMWLGGDASSDYLASPDAIGGGNSALGVRLLTITAADGQERSFLVPEQQFTLNRAPILQFGGGRDRWQVLPAPFQATSKSSPVSQYETEGYPTAFAPDGAGGFWLALRGGHFYHYTDRQPRPVFTDAPHPIRERIVGTASGPDSSFWVATASNAVYRYDRVTGWDRMTIPGWDPGRVVTNPSPAAAIAIGPDGSGVLVGKAGRIADLNPGGGVLDAAAGVLCSAKQNVAPCGTSRDLGAAAVAPDGSAIVGGEHMALLWRPGGAGAFRAIEKPREKSADTKITGISMPAPNRAWLTTDAGQVFAGILDGAGDWNWQLEADPSKLASGFFLGQPLPLHAIAIDSAGRGLAVGDTGLVLERDGDGSWRRLDTGRLDDFYSVALPPQGYGDGTLIGGEAGIVLSRIDGHFEVARPGDFFNGLNNGDGPANTKVVGLALLAGYSPGEVEVWAAQQMQPPQRFRPAPWPGAILHYASSDNPLLDGQTGRADPLPDVVSAQSGEISFAAFGKQECQLPDELTCSEMQGSNLLNEAIARRLDSALTGTAPSSTDSIPGASAGAERPQFAVFTGDAANSAGRDQNIESLGIARSSNTPNAPIDTDVMHHRWSELVAQPLQDAGVPLLGALGAQDLSQTSLCGLFTGCPSTRQAGNPGPNLPWREAMSQMPAPWGAPKLADGSDNKPPPASQGLSFQPVPASGVEGPGACTPPADTPPAKVSGQGAAPDQNIGSNHLDPQCASTAGAHTHYAVDVIRNGQPALRLVVVDTSLKTLSGAAATQNPVEDQLKWLADVLSSRPEGERAAVVSETPSYSYGPGALSDTLTDSAAFETLMANEHVDVVVSGRLGWNGLYYTSTLTPGLHCPSPGGAYPAQPCSPTGTGNGPTDAATQAAGTTAAGLAGGAQGAPPPDSALQAYPTVVAASAGGRFGPGTNKQTEQQGSAKDGFWHGYSLIRIRQNGTVIVEQRPVFDWIGVQGDRHVLRPGQKAELSGYGREPVGMDVPIRYDEISSPAITHRYDLVRADPDKPWLPLLEHDSDTSPAYVTLPGEHCEAPGDHPVGCIDSQSGAVRAGSGDQKRTFAIAILSVGKEAASWPLVFEPRPSFHGAGEPPALPTPPTTPAPPSPPAPAPAPPFNPPTLASPPALPPLPAQSPPAPPVPPAPPNSGAAQLDLFTSPPVLSVAPSISLFPPSPPVINVAPPTPARPVEKAKKVAVQSSGSDSDAKESSSQAQVDLADGPPAPKGSAMTRHDPNAFTAIAHRDQVSAWARDLQWGGGLTLMALVAAFGWITVRPTPKRREPEVPAPAWSRRRR